MRLSIKKEKTLYIVLKLGDNVNDKRKIPKGSLVIICGMSGSGKTTLAKKISEKYEDSLYVSNDRLRKLLTGKEEDQSKNEEIYKRVEEEIRDGLANKKRVIVDNTNLCRIDREKFYNIAQEYNSKVLILFFNVLEEDSRRRNLARKRIVPANVMTRQYERLKQSRIDIDDEEKLYNFIECIDIIVKQPIKNNDMER